MLTCVLTPPAASKGPIHPAAGEGTCCHPALSVWSAQRGNARLTAPLAPLLQPAELMAEHRRQHRKLRDWGIFYMLLMVVPALFGAALQVISHLLSTTGMAPPFLSEILVSAAAMTAKVVDILFAGLAAVDFGGALWERSCYLAAAAECRLASRERRATLAWQAAAAVCRLASRARRASLAWQALAWQALAWLLA